METKDNSNFEVGDWCHFPVGSDVYAVEVIRRTPHRVHVRHLETRKVPDSRRVEFYSNPNRVDTKVFTRRPDGCFRRKGSKGSKLYHGAHYYMDPSF